MSVGLFESEVEYLDYDDVVQLHESSLEDFGSLPGIHSNKLEAKLALPMSGFGDFVSYQSIEVKAAAYLSKLGIWPLFICRK
ncbi:hypothetical protein [Sporosarcina psychrophila]|uniref:hypothetical protein n=1 Tax=Sporosarcina psychrophila TaxID=1476 RepID=UPI00078DD0B4|nr:hypothetical protein [Sporosarcina psychrophila]AMQ05224.1 hypothetical protein AZE41_04325 [Sporosarcina psychrophila]